MMQFPGEFEGITNVKREKPTGLFDGDAGSSPVLFLKPCQHFAVFRFLPIDPRCWTF